MIRSVVSKLLLNLEELAKIRRQVSHNRMFIPNWGVILFRLGRSCSGGFLSFEESKKTSDFFCYCLDFFGRLFGLGDGPLNFFVEVAPFANCRHA